MKNKILIILNTILFIICLLLANIRFLGFNNWNDHNSIRVNTINYINDKAMLNDTFNNTEKKHLVEVKQLVYNSDRVLIILVSILVVNSIYLIKKHNQLYYFTTHLKTMYYSIGILSIIILLIFTNFYHFWNIFHQIFFDNDWFFNSGKMIDNFPLTFFKDKVLQIMMSFLSLSFIDIYICTKKIKKELMTYDISK